MRGEGYEEIEHRRFLGMRYGVADLSRLAGISVRTLHYYDEIGLLSPEGRGENNYRFYGPNEVDLLQQILFYRELGWVWKRLKRS